MFRTRTLEAWSVICRYPSGSQGKELLCYGLGHRSALPAVGGLGGDSLQGAYWVDTATLV